MVWDYTCVDTFATSNIAQSSQCAGAAAERASRAKDTKYECLPDSVSFIPAAMEITGAWAADGLRLVKAIGRRMADHTGEPRSTAHLLQAISVVVQRGNTTSILATLPGGKN